MKMFTKLIGLIMTLMLMSAIVVVQAQNQSATKLVSDAGQSVINASLQEEGVYNISESSSYSSEIVKKEDPSDAGVKYLVLPEVPGFYTTAVRAPLNVFKFQRCAYLISPTEMTASGFPSGSTVDAWGYQIYWITQAVGTLTGTLNIYLKNTTDVTNQFGLNWATGIASFTQVSSNANFTVPIDQGIIYEDFINGSTFTYTGGGVYVAWEFDSPAGIVGTVTNGFRINNLLSGAVSGAASNTALPGTLVGGTARAATWFGTNSFNDMVAVTNIYALEKYPVPYGNSNQTGVRVVNFDAAPVTFNLTLEVTDAATNTFIRYTNTQAVTGLVGSSIIYFPWTQTQLENVNVKAFTSAIPTETWLINNTLTIAANVNSNLFSYTFLDVPDDALGWTYPGTGIWAAKYTVNGTGLITGVKNLIFNLAANAGNTIAPVILDNTGTIVSQGPDYVIQTGDLGLRVNLPLSLPVLFTNTTFYAGIVQTAGTAQWYPAGIVTEDPVRAGAFYSFAIGGGTATEQPYRFGIEASVVSFQPYSLGVTNISAASSQLLWTSTTGLSDVEFGLAGFTPTGIPTHANVTSPITVTTAPNTSYSFYVRDNSGGTYSAWIGPYTFSTFCQDCPVGAIAEGEPQLPNGSDGSGINGGCAVTNPTLNLPIAFGQAYCGQSNTFINNAVPPAPSRDNDYYLLDLTTPANIYWHVTVTIKGNGLYNATLFANPTYPAGCALGSYGTVTTASACETGTIEADVPSGYYYVVARVATATGGLWPYGTGPWTYVLTVDGNTIGAPNLDPDPPATITKTVPPGGSTTQNLTIGNIGSYALDYAASTTGTYNLITADNFDSYTAGVQLACQAPAAWTTWSNLPCNAVEDGYVSNTYAFSGANSAKIVLNNDQVKLFGDLSSGVYKISFMQYIPTGKAGYFNILSDFTFGTGGYWGPQIYFNVDFSGELDANHTAIDFTWVPDAWKKVEVLVDLDNDVAEFIYDGTSVYTWPWTQGSSAGTGPLIIDAMDLFGATADDEMYFDDFKVEKAANDWLTLDGGLGAGGTIAVGGPSTDIVLGINSTGKPVGTYTKTINLATNELGGAKNSYVITVNMLVGYVLSGNVYYGHVLTNQPMTTLTTVTITPGPSVLTGPGGAYDIRPLAGGGSVYSLSVATTKPYDFGDAVAANDALLISRYVLGNISLTTVQKRAGDVNFNNDCANNDGLLIKRRVLGNINAWPAPNLNWVFATPGNDMPFGSPTFPPINGPKQVTINAADVSFELRMLETGDVNSSGTP